MTKLMNAPWIKLTVTQSLQKQNQGIEHNCGLLIQHHSGCIRNFNPGRDPRIKSWIKIYRLI